jgi:hypothetical protein
MNTTIDPDHRILTKIGIGRRVTIEVQLQSDYNIDKASRRCFQMCLIEITPAYTSTCSEDDVSCNVKPPSTCINDIAMVVHSTVFEHQRKRTQVTVNFEMQDKNRAYAHALSENALAGRYFALQVCCVKEKRAFVEWIPFQLTVLPRRDCASYYTIEKLAHFT